MPPIISRIIFKLTNTQQLMYDRLDEFYNCYKQNLVSLKDIAEPLNQILTKFKYYANVNNLRVNETLKLDKSGL